MKPNVTVYTDGACENNPGKGGFGIVLIYQKNNGETIQKNLSKAYKMTTNNRMELMAVIYALEHLKVPCNVKLYSDSKYVTDAINKNWLDGWQNKNWKNASKKPVKNIDLWKRFLKVKEVHNIEFIWVKGHDENIYNNLCDKMAVEARLGDKLETDSGFNLENQD